jgi:hypothetical protein
MHHQSRPGVRRNKRYIVPNRHPALLLAAVLLAGPAAAEGPDLLNQPFSLSLGSYILDTDTNIRLDASNIDTGTDLNFERAFGGGNATRIRFDGTWRFGDSGRHKLRGLWFDYSRSPTRTSDRTIEWGDEVFPISTEIRGDYRFTILELAYEYAFLRREGLELTGTAGLHYTQFKTGLSATLETPGGSGTREASATAKLDVPLPVVGGRALWHIGGDFWLDGSVQYFALSYDDYDGRIIDARIGVLWQPSNWVGIGLGYNRFDVDIDLEKSSWHGSLDWIYEGPQLFYSVSF